jgi:glycosyltransferase involved in cell wall biosynthesis
MDRKSSYNYELVIIDDGSTDATLSKIKDCSEKYNFVKFGKHPFNLGLTEALQTGFSIAAGNIYVFYPADLQYKPEDIPALVEPIVERGVDVVTGWKQGRYRKKFVSTVYNYLSRKIFGLKVHDLNSVKAFRADVIKDMFMRRDWHRYLVVMAADEGYKIDEVKVQLYERQWGKSKFSSLWRIPVGVLDMLAVKAQLSLLKKPLLFFGIIGFLFFALGILTGLVALYLRFMLNEGFRPLLYLVILFVGLGLGFFILGFLGEALTAVKEEISAVHKKIDKINKNPDS